jgi:hypothetical protein
MGVSDVNDYNENAVMKTEVRKLTYLPLATTTLSQDRRTCWPPTRKRRESIGNESWQSGRPMNNPAALWTIRKMADGQMGVSDVNDDNKNAVMKTEVRKLTYLPLTTTCGPPTRKRRESVNRRRILTIRPPYEQSGRPMNNSEDGWRTNGSQWCQRWQ